MFFPRFEYILYTSLAVMIEKHKKINPAITPMFSIIKNSQKLLSIFYK